MLLIPGDFTTYDFVFHTAPQNGELPEEGCSSWFLEFLDGLRATGYGWSERRAFDVAVLLFLNSLSGDPITPHVF